MSIVKQSFISNIISKSTYDQFLGYAKVIVAVGSCLLAICIGLSFFFHSSIINWFLQLLTGTSLLFIAYIAAWILILDVQVSVDEPERYVWKESEKVQRPVKYKLTIIWGIILIFLGISAIYISNKYRKHYAFECGTYLVDTQQHIYHVAWNDDCDVANEAEELEERYGYEIDDSYRLCESCKDFLDEMESYESERYIRR
jgi:hypothetical protein